MTKIDDSSIKELFKNAKKPEINVDKQAIFSKLQQRKNQALEEKTKSNKKKIWIRTGAALSFAMSCSLIIGLTLGLNQEKVKNYSNDYNYISNNSKSLAKQFYLIDNYTNDSNNESIKKAFDFNGILNDVKDIITQEFNKILLVFANTFYSFENMTGEVEKLNSPKEIDGKTYTCALKTRYLISSYTYYFNEDGIMQTGWMQVGNQWKYYSQGTLKIYGKTFVEGEKVTGWLPLGNRWYYIANDDYMVTGYYKVGNSTYYFDESGLMKTGWFKINGEDYYAASSGAIQAQWVKSLSNWYYVDVDGKMVTGYQTINGAKYYFASSGLMQKGWFKINGEDYYAASSGTIQAQWVKSGRNWYYVDTDGKMVTGDYTIDGKVNHFDNQGLWMN